MGLGIGLGFHGGGNVGVTVWAHGDHGFRPHHHRSRYCTGSHNHWKITIEILNFFLVIVIWIKTSVLVHLRAWRRPSGWHEPRGWGGLRTVRGRCFFIHFLVWNWMFLDKVYLDNATITSCFITLDKVLSIEKPTA